MAPATGVLESAYKLLMTRNSVYLCFVLSGAYVGERAVSNGIDSLWYSYNKGKLWKDIEPKLAKN